MYKREEQGFRAEEAELGPEESRKKRWGESLRQGPKTGVPRWWPELSELMGLEETSLELSRPHHKL